MHPRTKAWKKVKEHVGKQEEQEFGSQEEQQATPTNKRGNINTRKKCMVE